MAKTKSSKSSKPANKATRIGAKPNKTERPAKQTGAQRGSNPRDGGTKAKAPTPTTAKTGSKDAPSKDSKPVRVVRETRHLAVALTEAEIDERKHLVNRILLDIGKCKAQATSFAATSKANVATLEGQLSNAARELDSGQIFADVACHKIWDWNKKEIRVERTDTKEVVASQPMTKEDLQMTIPGVDPTKPKGPSKDKLPRAVTKSATDRLNAEADQSASELKARNKRGPVVPVEVPEVEFSKTKPDVSDDPQGRKSWNSDETDEDEPAFGKADKCDICGHPWVLGIDPETKLQTRVKGCQCPDEDDDLEDDDEDDDDLDLDDDEDDIED